MLMANPPESSSSLSYTSPSCPSNGSSRHASPTVAGIGCAGCLEDVTLKRLSSSLERLLLDSEFDCSDAEIEVDGEAVAVHRCILASRSNFFLEIFSGRRGCGGPRASLGQKQRYRMKELHPHGRHIGRDTFQDFLWFLYTGRLRPRNSNVSSCVDPECVHDACRPAISYAMELMYASYIFQIDELVPLLQRPLLGFVEKANVEDVVPILLVAFDCKLDQLRDCCVQRIAQSNLDCISIQKEFPPEIAENIKSVRHKSRSNQQDPTELARERGITKIHMALDSDDVALVRLLLNESDITLDDAEALHYAVAYCDSKVVAEVLELEGADINLKNRRGYTPLHVASMRGEPAVIMRLLTKGALALEPAGDGRSASNICRRRTRPKDYNARTEQGKESNKERICIELLEQDTGRNPIWEESIMSPSMAENLRVKILYLENRVSLAKLFFPTQAKLAMQIAETESGYALFGSKDSSNNLREVDLNETHAGRARRLHLKMTALEKTVELGRRYFPNCSMVLDNFMKDDDVLDLCDLDETGPDDQDAKRRRYHEIKEDVAKAFSKDAAENRLPGLCSSSHPTKGDRRQRSTAKK